MKNKLSHLFLCFLSLMSPKCNFAYRYRKNMGKPLYLNEPTTFNEKIIWLELYRYINHPLVIQCADKLEVRKYVSECGCENLLIPMLNVWDSPQDIKWDDLPDKFVLKWNFGAGFNFICSDKNSESRELVIQKMIRWGKSKYWLWYGEMHYKKIPPKVICEQYICDLDEAGASAVGSPEDYKFYCINGKVKYILVCMNRKGMKADYVFFDRDWMLQPFSKFAIDHAAEINMQRPELLDDAIKYAERLATPFPFVRVDFYILKDKIYFGELTFTPCGGVDSDLYTGDVIMGELLDVSCQNE